MTVREIQAAVGPDLWPDVDENFNEIRRQCAVQLQEQEAAHKTIVDELNTRLSIAEAKAARLDEIEKPETDRRKEALAAEIASKQAELESIP